jgi:hypothetical protein
MRKSLWFTSSGGAVRISIIALACLFLSTTGARADTFTYTYDSSPFGISWTTAPLTGVTARTTVTAADLTATSNTGSLSGCVTTSVVLDSTLPNGIITMLAGGPCSAGLVAYFPDGFAATDYTTPGTYVTVINQVQTDTLVVTPTVAAPEPSSVGLMLLGISLVFMVRKRTGVGLSRAS